MSFNIVFSAILVLSLSAALANGANILYLNMICSPSHFIWNSAYINALAARGHNVTVLSPDIDKNPPKNVHYILLEGLYNEAYYEIMDSMVLNEEETSPLVAPIHFAEYMVQMCKDVTETKGFHTLLSYPDDFKFDLLINDFSEGGCMLGFLHKFNYPPLISATAFNHPPYLVPIAGGHHYYSYVPHYALRYNSDMYFHERIVNRIVYMIDLYAYHYIESAGTEEMLSKAFRMNLPPVNELDKRTAIALVSTTMVLDPPSPLPINVIPVAGLHIREPKPLPKDLEDFIASSKKGAVLFSLGSNIKSSAMTTENQKMFLDAFKQFPDYHFLWKFEKPTMSFTLPKNVIIRPWIPQSDILNHTKTVLFITHSGSLSTLEAVWRGVPMVGVPFGFDQNGNNARAKSKGVAETINIRDSSTEIIAQTLKKVLENPKYMENAKHLSKVFRDQKETPLERAVWWAEYLLRNPDCEYLKSPVNRLGYIVGNSWDVIALFSILLFVALVAVIKVGLFIVSKIFGTSEKSSDTKLNGHERQKKRN